MEMTLSPIFKEAYQRLGPWEWTHNRSLRGGGRRSTCIVKMYAKCTFFSCAVPSRGIANLYSPVIRYSIVILYQ